MSNAPQPVAFWLSAPSRFSSDPELIRVDWQADGVTRSALGTVDDTRVVWDLGSEVPAAIDRDAFEAAWSQADYGDAHVPPGWTFVGHAAARDMEDAVECRCQACGVTTESVDDLSEQGECTLCFVSRMGAPGPVPPIAGTPEWLQTLRIAGCL